MKKSALLLAIILLLTETMFSLEVDKSELTNTSDVTIEFINYTGPHKVIDSIGAIKGIGSSLGTEVFKDTTKPLNTGNKNKYYVIHAVNPDEKGKLDADILIIGQDATVDHIVNLRRIIASYLESAYGYSESDADTLSVFITVYNAVYRGKIDTFKEKYKEIVVSNLNSSICGLSVNYKDWPGNSQIVIPLYDVKNGGLSTVDTSVISDTKVVSSMKEDDDKNVESRKEMVDIKEREADDASDKAQKAQKTAVEEKKSADEEKQKTQKVKKEAEEAQKEADSKAETAKEKQKIAEENPDNEEAQKDAQAAEEDAKDAEQKAEEKREELKQQEEKQAEQEAKAEEAKQEAKEQQARADKKQSEAQSERKEIAKDQSEIQKKETEEARMPVEYGIVLTDENQMLSKLVKFNKETGEIIKNSPVTVIRNRTIYKVDDSYIAIAGEDTKNGTIKLVSIDSESMEITGESDLKIAKDSVLIQDASDFYCVIDDKGKFYIGKFGNDLSLKLKSDIAVKSCTPITLTASSLVITDDSGKLKVLDLKTLSDISSGK